MLKFLWTGWIALTTAGAGWLFLALPGEGTATSASTVFLPGETTHGHYQIEMKCSACHLPDGGVTDTSCIDCHGADLKQSRDTHPKSKFRDPTKAELLQKIDVANCLTCHAEHQEERTHPMGVTVPSDYCFYCHQNVADDRPSHRDMAFDTCTNAGCHNYHDNTALYENFLGKHSGQPDILEDARTPERKLKQWLADQNAEFSKQLAAEDNDAPTDWQAADAVSEWAASAHALTGVNCSGCHNSSDDNSSNDNSSLPDDALAAWVETPNHETCSRCHDSEVSGFLEGRHGMRLNAGLTAMTPGLARLPMHSAAGHRALNCSACHDPHNPDVEFAAFKSCVSCHDDDHSRSYVSSSHHRLWQQEQRGEAAAGSGVSCATCHMPRDDDGRVQHNQNHNLRPNEKMARTVCMNCHGLQFTLDALADPTLKANCYSSQPTSAVQSLKMVNDWFESRKRK